MSLSSMLTTYRIAPLTGFAPETPCPSKFRSPHFSPWSSIAARLPELISTNAIRQTLDELPVLLSPDDEEEDGDGLHDYDEYRLAFVLLTFFAQAYIWGNISNGDQPSSTLPPSIAVPLTQVAYDIGVMPSFNYAAGSLWLFALETGHGVSKDVRCIVSFTGTQDEEHFNRTTNEVEKAGGRALRCALMASKAIGVHMDHAKHPYTDGVADEPSVDGVATEPSVDTRVEKVVREIVLALQEVASALKVCKSILNSMREGCDPDVFYTQLRPYLVGSQAVEGGVRYRTQNGDGVVHRFPGASAAQSPLFQSLDVLLGVKHSSGGREDFVNEMRKAMPNDHVRFIQDLSNLPSISAFISTQAENSDVRITYNDAIKALGEFRSEHVRIVTSYILQPSKKAAAKSNSLSSKESAEEAPAQGSGGSADLMGLLKGMRDDTTQTVLKTT